MGKTRGKFIVFEGIDGSGKTTQIERLAAYLRECGHRVYVTAEPTVSLTGGMLRDALSGLNKKTPCEMAAMFVLDRIYHNVNPVNGIEKMLSDGYDVICDRYYYSSLAYQGSETDYGWVCSMNLGCPEIRTPDLCVFLDLDPDTSLSRINSNRSTTEIYETREKLEKFRRRYFEIFDSLKENIAVINAAQNIDRVADDIKNEVNKLY